MKYILTLLFILITNIATAQESCQEFLDGMSKSIENDDLKTAKAFMNGFVTCKEESLGSNNPILNLLNKIEYITEFENERAVAFTKDGEYIIISKELQLIKELNVDKAFGLMDGRAVVKSNNKYGYINSNGEVIIPFNYNSAYSFYEGYADVIIANKSGFINYNNVFYSPNNIDFTKGLFKIDFNKKVIIKTSGNPSDFLIKLDKAILQYLPSHVVNSARQHTIPIEFVEKSPRFITMILLSLSMGLDESRTNIIQDWFNRLPLMTDDQIIQFDYILKKEMRTLKKKSDLKQYIKV